VGTDLTRIGERARKEPGLVLTSLYHHIYDVDNLRACYDTLEAKKATGGDGVTKRDTQTGTDPSAGPSELLRHNG
jgi:RNA-directed DNA polymerase